VLLRRGERLRLETPGGGGYGPPAERARDAVRRDLALGLIGEKAARRDYGWTG
jgi:N-methylhydantoinase B